MVDLRSVFCLMIRRPPRSTQSRSSAASDVYKRQVIGQGGYGFIYLAEDLRLSGRYCAVKEVSYDPSLPPELLKESREQFQREATVLARLDHPNLPKVSDYFSIEERDYLVMDYVPGDDLRTLVSTAAKKGEYLEEEEVLDCARQIGDALEYIHNLATPLTHW